MEIYSEEQLKRILKISKKNVIVEIMDMNNPFQFNLHKEINNLVLKTFNQTITLLKINYNFYPNLFKDDKREYTLVAFKNNQQLKIDSHIKNISDFKLFISSLF